MLSVSPCIISNLGTCNNLQIWHTLQIGLSNLATVVESDPNAPFSIATTLRCKGGYYAITWIAPLYPKPVPYNAEC